MMECSQQFEGCFCCSVGANVTDLHAMAFSFGEGGSPGRSSRRRHSRAISPAPCHRTTSFASREENELKVAYPVIDSLDLANRLKQHPMWNEFDARCVACGACTVACSTCTCFETTDIAYTQNARVGERRRTCSSCMMDGFDRMAGDQGFRPKASEKYRYKILHKVYGHDARFHTGPMCVGCGRCSARCPELISYPATLNKLAKAIEQIKREEEAHHA